jgi:hypothetical protein
VPLAAHRGLTKFARPPVRAPGGLRLQPGANGLPRPAIDLRSATPGSAARRLGAQPSTYARTADPSRATAHTLLRVDVEVLRCFLQRLYQAVSEGDAVIIPLRVNVDLDANLTRLIRKPGKRAPQVEETRPVEDGLNVRQPNAVTGRWGRRSAAGRRPSLLTRRRCRLHGLGGCGTIGLGGRGGGLNGGLQTLTGVVMPEDRCII